MSSSQKILEIACFNVESALIAAANGANRIELCQNYAAGGITPEITAITEVRQKTQIPLHVIIRPREGNFIYSVAEIETMKQQIVQCKNLGVNGVVFGVLTKTASVDANICRELIESAKGMSITFHRAIDQCQDIRAQFKNLVSLGINRVLSSGGCSTAVEGRMELRVLQKIYGDKIRIMPGGGLRAVNLPDLLSTGCTEFHSAAITTGGEIADREEIQRMASILEQVS